MYNVPSVPLIFWAHYRTGITTPQRHSSMFGELASATWKRQLLTELSYDTMNHFVHRYSTYADCVTFREIKVYLVCDFAERAVQKKKNHLHKDGVSRWFQFYSHHHECWLMVQLLSLPTKLTAPKDLIYENVRKKGQILQKTIQLNTSAPFGPLNKLP